MITKSLVVIILEKELKMNAETLLKNTENGEYEWEYEGGLVDLYRTEINEVLVKVSQFGTVYGDGLVIGENKNLYNAIREYKRNQVKQKLGWDND